MRPALRSFARTPNDVPEAVPPSFVRRARRCGVPVDRVILTRLDGVAALGVARIGLVLSLAVPRRALDLDGARVTLAFAECAVTGGAPVHSSVRVGSGHRLGGLGRI